MSTFIRSVAGPLTRCGKLDDAASLPAVSRPTACSSTSDLSLFASILALSGHNFSATAASLAGADNASLAITAPGQAAPPAYSVFAPTNDAVRAWLAAEGVDQQTLLGSRQQLESVAAYHATILPLSFADLGKTSGGSILLRCCQLLSRASVCKACCRGACARTQMPCSAAVQAPFCPGYMQLHKLVHPPAGALPCDQPPTVRLPSGTQLATQLPGALLTIHPRPAGSASSAAAVRVNGYASSAQLVRSNILICRALLHVVDAVLLVRARQLAAGGCSWL